MRVTATKAHAAGIGGGVGAAAAYLLAGLIWGTPSPEQLGALSVLITAGVGWVGAYFAPENRPK